MKKIIFLFLAIFTAQISIAQESMPIDYNQILSTTEAPSDAEIRRIINQFNYPPEVKEEVFQKTKKQLQDIYNTKDAKLMEQKAIDGAKLLQRGHLTPYDFMQ